MTTAGRIRSIRGHGKTCFATIEDESGRIQIYLRQDALGEKFGVVRHLDIGDFVGASGDMMRTKMGEVTIKVTELTVLAKAIEPLPAKWHGLSDVEIRYRRRYLDLIANPEVRETFRKRSRIVSEIRRFLEARGFLEVETPVLQNLAGGAAARPFVTHHNALDINLYLRIAPELYLKRLIVGGFEKVFELSKVFRNEGMDRSHNPEFTIMELYQAYADYNDMMNITEEIIQTAAERVNGSLIAPRVEGDDGGRDDGAEIALTGPWPRIPWFEAVGRFGGPMLLPGDKASAFRAAREREIDHEPNDYGACLEAIFDRYVEPNLRQPTFVIDYPTEISLLAKRKPGQPDLVERFELYIGCMEFANAFSELNDADDQEERFSAQAGDDVTDRVDHDFVNALRTGMPPTGGLGIGIDRLVMLLTGCRTIRDVVLFPAMRPEEDNGAAVDNVY